MATKEVLEKMESLIGDDAEHAHLEADMLLCEVLSSLGENALVSLWHKVSKGYA